MFLLVSGKLLIRLRDREVVLEPGEFLIVPKGTAHQPVALEESCVLLFEPAGTLNTGDRRNALTRDVLPRA
ncbi:cupin domain-containing protein [Arenimonas sp. GDDSR-1]|uniref:cupin domain-containing protein n=1 Tax=Arenimonas sp. GDDSR-1 TaxID=2950125 RepID=UPI002632B0B0|nr:cupin domain-containing protein [Arenimonas sp. GDDSR-1]